MNSHIGSGIQAWRNTQVAEEAPLLRVWVVYAARGFKSRFLRLAKKWKSNGLPFLFLYRWSCTSGIYIPVMVFWKTTINRKKSSIKIQHFVVNKINKNFQKKVLHLRFGFAIITFARLKRAWNLGNKQFSKKFQKNFKKVLDRDFRLWYSKWVAAMSCKNKHLDK